jgi:hypothetical protein
VIHIVEHHDQVLHHWRELGLESIDLAHLDFHDDLRGLLIDRPRQVAYAIAALAEDRAPLDPGNWLAHAVLEGRMKAIEWVHHLPGGRAWDTGIVRYESDWMARGERRRHRQRGGREVPLGYRETLLDSWKGVQPGQLVSIDWDCIASSLQPRDGLEARIELLLDRLGENVPEHAWLCYSPEYVPPTLPEMEAFAATLAARWSCEIEWRAPGLREGEITPAAIDAGLPKGWKGRLALWLRRRGLFEKGGRRIGRPCSRPNFPRGSAPPLSVFPRSPKVFRPPWAGNGSLQWRRRVRQPERRSARLTSQGMERSRARRRAWVTARRHAGVSAETRTSSSWRVALLQRSL